MSTAANHRKRSHRSEYRAAPYHSGKRYSVGKPTMAKRSFFEMIRKIIAARRINRQTVKKSAAADPT